MKTLRQILSLIESDVIDLGQARQNRSSKKFERKIQSLSKAVPEALDKQRAVEQTVNKKVMEIHNKGKNKFALPHIQSQYGPNIHSIEALDFHMPLISGTTRWYMEEPDPVVEQHVRENKQAILDDINEKIKQFESLRSIANEAPAPQYPNGVITNKINHWSRMRANFAKHE